MIVSPPKAGKTTLLKADGTFCSENNPEVHLLILLIDERPEEVDRYQGNDRRRQCGSYLLYFR